ncbi:FER1L4 isoform 8, partial [Pan troglodytes]
PLGTLVISLQQLQNAGHLVLREALVDENLRVSPIQVELDLKYQPPEGATGAWSEEDFGAPIQDSFELIIPNVGFQELEPGEAQLERRAVALGRRLARSLGQQDNEENELELELEQDLDDEPDVELSGVMFSPLKRSGFLSSSFCTSQVGVTVLEAQKLVGVNINPYVAVQVGGQRRVTATQRGTSCPFYNEYFLFEFHDTRLHLQDLLLEITGETSVRAEAAAPEWNEQLSFVELFPPLTRSLRLQLRDDAPLVDAALATHVLDLRRISHPGRAAGFNPTFGPAWVPLYGSPPGAGLRDSLQGLNEGVGQGIWFRGRLLLAVSMQVLEGRAEPEPPQAQQGSTLSRLTRKKKKKARRDQTPKAVPQHLDASPGAEGPEIPRAMEVEVEELLPLPENVLAPCEDFLLFGVLFEATMIDPAVASQPISFEISIGRAGRLEEQLGRGSRAGEGTEGAAVEAQPLLGPRPEEEKEEEEPGTPAQRPEPMDGSGQFCRGAERRTMTRPNALDRCRGKLLVHSLNLLAKQGLRLLRGLRRNNVQKKVALAKKLLAKLRFLAEEAPGAAPGEVCAKLELFLWLGLGKQAKACTSELPPDLLPEPSAGLPSSLHRDDFSYFQLRAHLYQARGVLAADDSGLSDPFARVLISTQCQTTRVLEQTLSPLWNELLVFEQLIVDGRREHLQEEPPLVIINVFDHNKFGPPVFLGRALAAPRVKLMEDPYQRPELQFFPLRKGPRAAGELIAAFELIELDYSGRLEPSVPSDVEPQDLAPLVEPHSGRLSLPPNVCPVLREFRVEVLFWGLRGLGRVHLFEVEQPQVVLEVAGQRVESEVLASYRERPNFTELVRHLTVDLPEQPYLQPPLSILVIERRAFGRTVLVGSHIVPHMLRFTFRGHEDPPEEEGEMEETGDMMPKGPQGQKSLDPFLAEAGISRQLLKPPLKKLPLGGLLNQGPGLEEDIPDPEELDWWSKYYASLQELQGQHNLDEDEMDDPGDSDGVNLISMVGEIQDQGEAEVKGTVSPKKAVATLKIYNRSLEEEFNHFEDWLNVFPLSRGQGGQDGGGEEEGSGHLVGKFKGSFLIYPESEAVSFSEPQISRGIPQNRPIKLLVRVYIVKATNLAPADPNGKADPYVVVSAGRERQDTKERYIPKQLNPIFGDYELRVVIWNTEDVVLDDENPLTGEMSSDIYVKSWVKGLEHDKQETDVHFNSLTGEGNFNWRFVFRFDYLPTEREVSVRRRSGPFALEEAEFRQPAVLVLQVWDYDRISANDFLGSLELQLPDMVRGARGPELCSVRLARDGAGSRCNLFRCRRLRGWWPVVKLKEAEDVEREAQEAQAGKKKRKQRRRKGRPEDLEFTDTGGNVYILTGKVEAEFELLTVEEAEKRPVGKGRKQPEPLEKPSRPKTSFNWFVNPLKTFVFFIWRRYWRILVLLLLLVLLTVFLLLVFYTIPGQISQVIFRPLHK